MEKDEAQEEEAEIAAESMHPKILQMTLKKVREGEVEREKETQGPSIKLRRAEQKETKALLLVL